MALLGRLALGLLVVMADKAVRLASVETLSPRCNTGMAVGVVPGELLGRQVLVAVVLGYLVRAEMLLAQAVEVRASTAV